MALDDIKQPQLKGEVLKLKAQSNWLQNIAAASLVFVMLIVAYNWKDYYKSLTKSDVVTTSITILGDDGKAQFVIDKYGISKVDGTVRTKVLDNVAGNVELNVDRLTAKGVKASAIDADVTSSNSFIYVDKRGNRIVVENHLNTRKVGDAP